jgi:hypothetical protein
MSEHEHEHDDDTLPDAVTFAADIASRIDTALDDDGDLLAALAVIVALVLNSRFAGARRGGILMSLVKYVIDGFDMLDKEAEQEEEDNER